jgi:hypothetical protein
MYVSIAVGPSWSSAWWAASARGIPVLSWEMVSRCRAADSLLAARADSSMPSWLAAHRVGVYGHRPGHLGACGVLTSTCTCVRVRAGYVARLASDCCLASPPSLWCLSGSPSCVFGTGASLLGGIIVETMWWYHPHPLDRRRGEEHTQESSRSLLHWGPRV